MPDRDHNHHTPSTAPLDGGSAPDIVPSAAPVAAVDPPKKRAQRKPLIPFRRQPAEMPERGEQLGSRWNVVLSAAALTVILSLIMLLPGIPVLEGVRANQPAGQDIYAPADARFESEVLTERAREAARNDPANEVWVQNPEVVAQQRSALLSNLSVLNIARGDETLYPGGRDAILRDLKGITLTSELLSSLLMMQDNEFSSWRQDAVIGTFDNLMREGRISSDADLQAVRAALPNRVPPYLSLEPKSAAIAFISPMLAVNMQLDEAETAKRQEAAAARIRPVVVQVQRGEAIVKQGLLITPEAIEKMQHAGLLNNPLTPLAVLGAVGMVAILMLLLHLYLYRAVEPVWRRRKQLLLFGLLIVVTVGVARVFLPGHALLPYLLPVAAVSMLIAVLLSGNLAVVTTFVLSLLLGIAVSNGLTLELPVYYLVGGLTGVFSLTRIEKVSTFMRAGLAIALALFATAVLMEVLEGGAPTWTDLGNIALAVGFNAGISTAITYAAFSILGTLFGITTPIQLMELAHPDQPLMRRLMRDAPGTYHHSLVVGNLAERAAETIGADPLLTRVCAYYHDIGKAERPYYFIDNQSGMANVHDSLDPRQSAQIIIDHVRDGIRLAKRERLPNKVIDAIPQHHGTMLVKYFYLKALADGLSVTEAEFRYRGPKPQTKEAAILMLADGVEATVRSMAQSGALDKMASNSDATENIGLYGNTRAMPDDALATVVHRVISERIEDGQLDECDLTVRDIVRIQEAFVSMLKGIYHPRVPYPEERTAPAPAPALAPAAANGAGETQGLPAPAAASAPANGHSNGVLAGNAKVPVPSNGHTQRHDGAPTLPPNQAEEKPSEHRPRPATYGG
jgi:cyclic-di-AMP phosphodiesterase PgpH